MNVTELITRADAALGAGLERAVCAHHTRRLTRVGWQHALDAPPGGWSASAAPPRPGNALEVLVDGATALPRIAALIRSAQRHVHLAGWFVTPDMPLVRTGEDILLRELLREVAQHVDVRILLWAGAPVPLFRPDRGLVEDVVRQLRVAPRVQVAADRKERPLHCYHEKLVIVDDEVATVGGIDLTTLAGDRYDEREHPARETIGWHDAAALVRGPAVADVAAHFRLRWRDVTGEQLSETAPPQPVGNHTVQLVRTVPERIYHGLPRGAFTILEAYSGALRMAERFIYLENQFLWSPEIVRILAAKLADPPSPDFRVVLVLPAHPNNGGDDTRGQLGRLMKADDGAGRLLACTLYALPRSANGVEPDVGAQRPVYVHAKIGIVDDRWLTLGSANLNEHSLFNDSEVNLVCDDADLARAVRLSLWAEHLERDVDEVAGDPTQVVDALWRPIAEEQLARRERGEPLTHRLLRLQHVSRRADGLRGPLKGLLVDG
jgi:phosphatidylserine/phosphatidylglycerophosphate/cardiolipin synthase-like enzyme